MTCREVSRSNSAPLMAPEDWDSIERNTFLGEGDDDDDGEVDDTNIAIKSASGQSGDDTRPMTTHDSILLTGSQSNNKKKKKKKSVRLSLDNGEHKDTERNDDNSVGVMYIDKQERRGSREHDKRIGMKVSVLALLLAAIGAVCSTLSAFLYNHNYVTEFTDVHIFLIISHWLGSTACVTAASVPARVSNCDMTYRDDSKREEKITILRVVHVIFTLVLVFSSYLYFSVPPFFPGVILFCITIMFVRPQFQYSQYLGLKHPGAVIILDTVSGKLAVAPLLGAILFTITTLWNINNRPEYMAACVINKEWICSETYWDYESAPEWMLVLDFCVYLFGLFYLLYTTYQVCTELEPNEIKSSEVVYATAAKLLYQNINLYVRIFSITFTFWGVAYLLHVEPQSLGIGIVISGLSSFFMQALFMVFGRKAYYSRVSAFIICLENIWATMAQASGQTNDTTAASVA